MLKIISPKGHKYHQSSIEAFLDLLRVYQNYELSEEKRWNATFLIAEDQKQGVYGGALLYPQKIKEYRNEEPLETPEDTFHGAFVTFQPQVKEFWIARICYCLEANIASSLNDQDCCNRFYDDLYEELLQFGNGKGIEFIAFSLCAFEAISPPLHESWPYNTPIRSSDDRDGLFHGILSLKGTRFLPKVSRKSKLQRARENQNQSYGSARRQP